MNDFIWHADSGNAVQGSMRVAVTGANGWLGREFIDLLSISSPETQILALGSKASKYQITTGKTINVVPWHGSEILDWEPTHLVHLAFVTKEKLCELGEIQYRQVNRSLTLHALEAFHCQSLRGVVVASSGAAVVAKASPYGALKRDAEEAFIRRGRAAGVPTVVSRIWSVSGKWCTKPNLFLFFDVLSQVLGSNEDVFVQSGSPVLRRYCDAGRYLLLSLYLASLGESRIMDSGGELVEASELAQRAIEWAGKDKRICRSPSSGLPDSYYSRLEDYEELSARLGVPALSLEEQFSRSSEVFVGRHGLNQHHGTSKTGVPWDFEFKYQLESGKANLKGDHS